MASLTSKIIVKKMPDPMKILDGKSSYDRARQKEQLACIWLLKNGYATADILRRVVAQKAPGYENQLIKKDLIKKTKSTVAFVPRFFYTLTESGAALAQKFITEKIDYKYFEPWKISQSTFLHDFLAQELTLDVIESGFITRDAYIPSSLFIQSGNPNLFQPEKFQADVIWTTEKEEKICAVVELRERTGRQLDLMLQVLNDGYESDEYDSIVFFSDSASILSTYASALRPGAKYHKWQATDLKKGSWVRMDEKEDVLIYDGLSDKVNLRLIGKKYFYADPRNNGHDPADRYGGL